MNALKIITLSLLVSACTTNPHVVPAVASEQDVVCTMEKPTGSNRPVKVCRPAAGTLDREDTERDMRVLQRQTEILSNPN